MERKLQNRIKSLKFYRKNRDDINKKRRELYLSDPRIKELARIRNQNRDRDSEKRKKHYPSFNKRRRERYRTDESYRDKEIIRSMFHRTLAGVLSEQDIKEIREKSNNLCTFCKKSQPDI